MRKVIFNDVPSIEKARKRSGEAQTFVYDFVTPQYLNDKFHGKKFFIRTYGCQANYRDEETLGGLLSSLGMVKTDIKEECDIAILNTCAVRENAEDKVYGEIGEFKNIKAKKESLILMLCGCMIEQKHIIDHLLDTFPYIDILFGTHNIQNVLKLLDQFENNNEKKRIVDVSSEIGNIYEELPCERISPFKAFVNISYGCNKFCTYCIVPYTRGKERSRKMEDILLECKELVNKGYKEITLLGQNVDSYGFDLHDGSTFAKLLEEVAKLGIPRLRFLTSYPSDFKDDVIDVIAKYDNIMKYIHLPIQSGNDEILRLMGRRYNVATYMELVNKIKAKMPDIALSTDIIVGFPNETYEQFLDTIKVSKEVGYASAFTFIYSPRKGTPAANLKDNVTYDEKVKRFKELVKALELNINKVSESMVGKTYEVLVESVSKKNDDFLSGFTEGMKTINFKGNKNLIGKLVKVKVLENHLYFLTGELINE